MSNDVDIPVAGLRQQASEVRVLVRSICTARCLLEVKENDRQERFCRGSVEVIID